MEYHVDLPLFSPTGTVASIKHNCNLELLEFWQSYCVYFFVKPVSLSMGMKNGIIFNSYLPF